MKNILLFCFVFFFAVVGCQKKVEKVPVGEMNDYKDPAYGFKIKYPKDWLQLGTAGKALFCKSQEVANKFLDPRTGEEGAEVTVEVMHGRAVDSLINASKEDLKQIAQLKPDEKVAVASKQATKVSYSIRVTSKANIDGYNIYVPGDTAVYRLEFAGYGEQYPAHSLVFDAMLASFELPVVVAKRSETWQASPNFEKYTSDYFTMQYADNLNFVSQNKGDKDLVIEMRADRQDCSIHVDVFGAKKLPVEKVWEQNKGKYKAKGTGETTIDGAKAYWVDYSPPVKDVSSRAYFVVKNDKVVRITINWFVPQKDIYFPAFEKCVNSIKLK